MEKELERVVDRELMSRICSMVRRFFPRLVRSCILTRYDVAEEAVDQINARALQVVDRVQQKLTGRDFKPTVSLAVNEQVDKLIASATMVENLAVMFVGWSVLSSLLLIRTSADACLKVFLLVIWLS